VVGFLGCSRTAALSHAVHGSATQNGGGNLDEQDLTSTIDGKIIA
jgi:hypothetical protein